MPDILWRREALTCGFIQTAWCSEGPYVEAQQAFVRHATRAEYAFMTPAEIEADIAQRAEGGPANIDRRDGDQRAAAHATRLAIRDEVLAARATDPAGWALRDEGVAAAYQAAQENPDNPALARHATRQRLALQCEMDIDQPRLLSDAERDEIAGRLAQAAPADRPALIADLRARYGVEANMLAAELTGEVDANTALLLAHAEVPHLPRLIAQGMEKAKKDGPAKLTLASPDALNDLPALPLVGTGVPGGYKLDIPNLKSGWTYRAPGGAALFYNGEMLVPSTVEIAAPNPADPNAPTPPLPLGKAGPAGARGALEQNAQGSSVPASAGGEIGKIGQPQIGDDSKREFKEWPDDTKPQAQKPRREFSAFNYGTMLINHAKEQGALSKIASGASPHVFVIPNQQDQVMNDPEHPYNVYADATAEQRREINRAAAEEAKDFAENWVRNINALENTPDTPKFGGDMLEPYIVGKVSDSAINAVGKTPVLKELSGTDEMLRRTLVEEGYDPLDAESVASAVMNPDFWPKLQKNLDKHWGDAAINATFGAAKTFVPFLDWIYTPGGEISQRSDTPDESDDKPGEFSSSVKKQLRKPQREFGEFVAANSLINQTLEQEELSKIAAGASPHVFVIPNQQDQVMNDPEHPYNIYASASPEERGEFNEVAYEKSLEFGKDWIRHRKALEKTPGLPKFKDDLEANPVGSAVGQADKYVKGQFGAEEIAGADDPLYKTLIENGYDPDDAESVAIATMDPLFWPELRKNLNKYWAKAAGKLALDAGLDVLGGNARKFLGKKNVPGFE